MYNNWFRPCTSDFYGSVGALEIKKIYTTPGKTVNCSVPYPYAIYQSIFPTRKLSNDSVVFKIKLAVDLHSG